MGTARKLDVEIAKEMLRAGKNRREIADEFGCTPQAVSHALKLVGMDARSAPVRRPRRAWVAEALRLAGEGRSLAEIAAAVGKSSERVRKVCRAEGFGFRDRVPDEVRDEVLRLRREGLKLVEIAAATGVSPTMAGKVCRDAASGTDGEGLLKGRRRKRERRFGEADRKAILELHGVGMSQAAIAAATGWSQSTVSKVVRG